MTTPRLTLKITGPSVDEDGVSIRDPLVLLAEAAPGVSFVVRPYLLQFAMNPEGAVTMFSPFRVYQYEAVRKLIALVEDSGPVTLGVREALAVIKRELNEATSLVEKPR